MTLVSNYPGREFGLMNREMNRLRNRYRNRNIGRPEQSEFVPKVDIYEDENNVYFDVEVPGIPKDHIKVRVTDENVLSISGEKKFDEDKNINLCCRSERRFGSFSRQFQIPDNLETDKIEAKYNNGVLKLVLPKVKEEEPEEKEIAIS